MATSRVRRGRSSEEAVAQFLRDHGWPSAERVPASIKGADIVKGIAGVAIEVKARRSFDPVAFFRQAKKNARGAELPVVVMRPDGAGEASVGKWLVFTTLEEFVDLVKEAGYGDE